MARRALALIVLLATTSACSGATSDATSDPGNVDGAVDSAVDGANGGDGGVDTGVGFLLDGGDEVAPDGDTSIDGDTKGDAAEDAFDAKSDAKSDATGDAGDGATTDATVADGALDVLSSDGASDGGSASDGGVTSDGASDGATSDAALAGGCSVESDCSGSARCGGPSTCAGAVCFVCSVPPATAIGTGRAACTDASTCASGLCDGLRGHCSAPCDNTSTLPGAPDKGCTDALGAGLVCTEVDYSIGTASRLLGFCALGCARNADCAGELCQGTSNSGANRIDLTCGPARVGSTKTFGAACTPGAGECDTGLCLSTTSGTITTSTCGAFCVTNAECTAPLANCGTITFTKPGGGTQSAKACVP